ncbi:unnamed protein product, partial [Lymnaea stagnalis]
SGISSSNASLDNFLYGHNKYTSAPSYTTHSPHYVGGGGKDDLAKALHKINSELSRVLNYIDRDGE